MFFINCSLIELSMGIGLPSSSTLTKVEVVSHTTTSSWEYKFDEETMIFFPSYMRHMTSIVIDDNPRISFSFNIFLRGILSNTITQNLIL